MLSYPSDFDSSAKTPLSENDRVEPNLTSPLSILTPNNNNKKENISAFKYEFYAN